MNTQEAGPYSAEGLRPGHGEIVLAKDDQFWGGKALLRIETGSVRHPHRVYGRTTIGEVAGVAPEDCSPATADEAAFFHRVACSAKTEVE